MTRCEQVNPSTLELPFLVLHSIVCSDLTLERLENLQTDLDAYMYQRASLAYYICIAAYQHDGPGSGI